MTSSAFEVAWSF